MDPVEKILLMESNVSTLIHDDAEDIVTMELILSLGVPNLIVNNSIQSCASIPNATESAQILTVSSPT